MPSSPTWGEGERCECEIERIAACGKGRALQHFDIGRSTMGQGKFKEGRSEGRNKEKRRYKKE